MLARAALAARRAARRLSADAQSLQRLLAEATDGHAAAQYRLGCALLDLSAQQPANDDDAEAKTEAETAQQVIAEIRAQQRANRKAKRDRMLQHTPAGSLATDAELLAERGEQWLRAAAEQGVDDARVRLGNVCWARDDAEGARGWWRAAEAHPDALYNLGTDAEARGDVQAAVALMRRSEAAGDATAAFWLGHVHRVGAPEAQLAPDGDAALALLQRAADADHAPALHYLHQLLRFGDDACGVAARPAGEWRPLLERAAALGDADALAALGELLVGEGDRAGAVRAFEGAAQRGHAVAFYNLGALHFEAADYGKAAACYHAAGELDCVEAWRSLAHMFLHGIGVERSVAQAEELLSVARRLESLRWTELAGGAVLSCGSSSSSAPDGPVVAFDLDLTLVQSRSGDRFWATADDWQWSFEGVAERLHAEHAAGSRLIVFSNQAGVGDGATDAADLRRLVAQMQEQLPPVEFYISTQRDAFRKPLPGMWALAGCALDEGVFVGDGAGRPGDHTADDVEFAKAVGAEFRLPEEYFGV